MSEERELYDRALKAFKDERLDVAIPLLEKVIKDNPQFLDAYEALGVMYFHHGKVDEAIGLMKELAKRDPESIMARTNLSRFYVAKGWIDEAEEEQAEARRLSWKAELKAKKEKGDVLPPDETEEDRRKKFQQKIETYQKVIEMDPEDVLGYFSIGSAYLEAKMYPDAILSFSKAVLVSEEHSPSYVGWGEALEAMDQVEEACEVYRRGIEVAEKQGDIIPLRKMESRVARRKNK